MNKYLYIAAAVAVIGAAVGCYEFGVSNEHQARVAEVNGLKAQAAESLAAANKQAADAQQAARDTEAKRVAEAAALDAQYQKELKDAQDTADHTIADLRAGTLSVRKRLTCASTGLSGTGTGTTPGTSASVADAGAAGGLQDADVEFLLREAERADEVTLQLQALQALVRSERASQGE
jgi:hypothetical protein